MAPLFSSLTPLPFPSSSSTPSSQWFSSVVGNLAAWPQSAVIPHGVSVHLNFHGEARVICQDGTTLSLAAGSLTWIRVNAGGIAEARRLRSGGSHECLTLHFPDAWIREVLPVSRETVVPALRSLLLPPFAQPGFFTRALTRNDRLWALPEAHSPSQSAAHQVLESSRLTEFLFSAAFGEGLPIAPKVSLAERMAHERVERVKSVMMERLEAAPDMAMLALLAGCTVSHLSRSFTRAEGITLSLWLRRARIERAATLIATGACNVSEAALRVGYRSLSHFSRAFLAEKGISPSHYARHMAEMG